ncbi:hypothetical protein BCR34DRAFT_605311 [Clohesyomyces aquaticus]|uniref:Uncharacterized protein n=1 Tax=Clohesyomyces aquaticus TaxID=1231657 RepID=A0A1Y1YZ58_9PLEO|nr:hypothetical protein BCR34DRAFT_605311 [Clohesyomyces aquaticus]
MPTLRDRISTVTNSRDLWDRFNLTAYYRNQVDNYAAFALVNYIRPFIQDLYTWFPTFDHISAPLSTPSPSAYVANGTSVALQLPQLQAETYRNIHAQFFKYFHLLEDEDMKKLEESQKKPLDSWNWSIPTVNNLVGAQHLTFKTKITPAVYQNYGAVVHRICFTDNSTAYDVNLLQFQLEEMMERLTFFCTRLQTDPNKILLVPRISVGSGNNGNGFSKVPFALRIVFHSMSGKPTY